MRDSSSEAGVNERKRRAAGALAVVAAAVMVLLVTSLRERFGQKAGVTEISRRQVMTGVEMKQAGGGRWRLEDHRGEVVAMNFWATWCGPCREEIPTLERTVRELGPRGFGVVGVSLDEGDREEKVRAFAARYGVTYPMAFPDAMSQMSAGLEGIPTTLLIDRRGRVAKTYVGEVRESVLRSDVGTLLAE